MKKRSMSNEIEISTIFAAAQGTTNLQELLDANFDAFDSGIISSVDLGRLPLADFHKIGEIRIGVVV